MPDETFYTAWIAWSLEDEPFTSRQAALAAAKRGDAEVEEIEVDARSWNEAREKVAAILAEQYEPGGFVVRHERRWRGVMYL